MKACFAGKSLVLFLMLFLVISCKQRSNNQTDSSAKFLRPSGNPEVHVENTCFKNNECFDLTRFFADDELLNRDDKFDNLSTILLMYKPHVNLQLANIDKSSPFHKLAWAESAAIASYTWDLYFKINATLDADSTTNLDDDMIGLVKLMSSGLNKLPIYTNDVFRCIELSDSDYNAYNEGQILVDKIFVSTSRKVDIARKFCGITDFALLSFTSKYCRWIAPISKIPEEDEVLCYPGGKYRIIKKLRDNGHLPGIKELQLEQL